MKHSQQGITLMEALISLAIVGILATLTVAGFGIYISGSRVSGAAEGVYQDLSRARGEAVRQQATVRFVFQAGSSWCYGLTTAGTCDCQSAGSCNLGQNSVSAYANTTLAATTTSSPISFASARGTASPVGTLTVTNSAGSVSVIFNSMGFARICSSNVGGYESCT